jgi:hypothetical protein
MTPEAAEEKLGNYLACHQKAPPATTSKPAPTLPPDPENKCRKGSATPSTPMNLPQEFRVPRIRFFFR